MLENRDLLLGFKEGNSADLARVYRLYVHELVAFLKRGFLFEASGTRMNFGGFKEAWHLENAVQEVFIKAFSVSAREAYDGLRPFRNFLFRIAKNAVIDEFRQNKSDALKVEAAESLDAVATALPDGLSDPEAEVETKQFSVFVTAVLDALDAATRSLFELRFVEGLSVEECALKLHISEYRVKRDEKRIKKHFFHRLKEHGYFSGYRYDGGGARLLFTFLWAAAIGMKS